MKEKIKNTFAILVVILLLPYVLTILFTGSQQQHSSTSTYKDITINVNYEGIQGQMELEQYLTGVVAKEVPMSYELETLKTQAVIARTNIVKLYQEAAARGEEIIFEEPYLAFEKINGTEQEAQYARVKQAVEETKGMVARYKGNLVELPYHAISAGKTRSGEEVFKDTQYSYLLSVESSKDLEAKDYLSIRTFTKEKILELCQTEYPDLTLEDLSVVSVDSADYALQVRLGNYTIAAESFRNLLQLNSSCMGIEVDGDSYKIATKGLGHGVGLSQYGANQKALDGQSYVDILSYFFDQITVEKIVF